MSNVQSDETNDVRDDRVEEPSILTEVIAVCVMVMVAGAIGVSLVPIDPLLGGAATLVGSVGAIFVGVRKVVKRYVSYHVKMTHR